MARVCVYPPATDTGETSEEIFSFLQARQVRSQ